MKNVKVEEILHDESFSYSVMVPDVDKLMEIEQKANQKLAFSSGYDYSKYGTWDEVCLNSLNGFVMLCCPYS